MKTDKDHNSIPRRYFKASTLDDLIREVLEDLLQVEERVVASRGRNAELFGVLLELSNPRSRLSITETRGKVVSCIGELCWYLSGSNRLDFIEYYLSEYKESANGEIIHGGYGPRLMDWEGVAQLRNVTDRLKSSSSTRKAVIQLFDRTDLLDDYNDVPCTCTLQFVIREDELHLLVSMRSNDVVKGLTHDVFAFTMIQELLAMELNVGVGTYRHAVGSLHLYDRDRKRAVQFLNEGWQSSKTAMPAMPTGDPWPSIKLFLDAEEQLRCGLEIEDQLFGQLDPYWADLVLLLQVFKCRKDGTTDRARGLRRKFTSPMFLPFVNASIYRK